MSVKTMSYYSFVVQAKEEVGIESHRIILARGNNTFTTVTDDLDGLLRDLKDHGVSVVRYHCLDMGDKFDESADNNSLDMLPESAS